MTNLLNSVSVERAGRLAAKGLADAGRGSVAAVFRSTFYVQTGAGCYCVGAAGLEPSGLNLVTAVPPGIDWASSGVRCGMKVRVRDGVFEVGPVLSFRFTDAATWSPELLPAGWTRNGLVRGLQIVRDDCVNGVPHDGLGRFIQPGCEPAHDDIVCRHAKAPLVAARRCLVEALRADTAGEADWSWAHALVGLGPGLTPSGDDFLGAVMIALNALNRRDLSDRLWDQLGPFAGNATNPISLAHLHAASRGYGVAALHDAMSALVTGDESAIRRAAARLDRIGHTSGWDALTGAVYTFDAWAQARRH